MGSEDHGQNIVKGKGKRTKRQRSSSPFGLASTMTDSSSSGSAVRGGEGEGERERGGIIDDYNSIYSPTTSGEIYESTEEEEDMANCLIMLAQGDCRPKQIQQNMNREFKIEKLSNSPKFSNKAGFYAYECKTCNRSFPSFQALGGHRASHKKPKAAAFLEKKSSGIAVLPLKDDYSEEFQQFNKTSPPAAAPLSGQAIANNNIKANKIHECSICGSEFTSGQALGGHMRRHRAAAAAASTGNNPTYAAINNINIDADASNTIIGEMKPATGRSILPLDLNLPAPEDHDHHLRDSKFQFGFTQQALVFSAPTLVGCHY